MYRHKHYLSKISTKSNLVMNGKIYIHKKFSSTPISVKAVIFLGAGSVTASSSPGYLRSCRRASRFRWGERCSPRLSLDHHLSHLEPGTGCSLLRLPLLICLLFSTFSVVISLLIRGFPGFLKTQNTERSLVRLPLFPGEADWGVNRDAASLAHQNRALVNRRHGCHWRESGHSCSL